MLVIRGQRVVLPEGERPASIHIDQGVIGEVRGYDDVSAATDVVDAGSLMIIPGLVDTHVHVNEPGRTEWEGFDTATRAAAAGGITTIIDMPLNSIPATTDVDALEAKRHAARGQCHVDVGFWGGIVPGNDDQIEPLIAAGVRGFKCFMTPSGVDEFKSVSEADLGRAMSALARSSSPHRPVLVHAEDPSRLREPAGDRRAFSTFVASRPIEAEVRAIETVVALAARYHVAAHIVHVSSSDGAAAVARGRAKRAMLTAETCPHYLTFSADDVPDGATAFKCAPPIRSPEHRERLWTALRDGVCSLVVTDHSPAPPAMKHLEAGDFISAWGGIASLELSLATVWTGASKRGFAVSDVVRWMSHAPAQLSGLAHRKGSIRPGYDADLVLWDPTAQIRIRGDVLQQRHKLTAYDGRVLQGSVRATYVRGVKVWEHGGLAVAGRGCLL
jgi:allantoinase